MSSLPTVTKAPEERLFTRTRLIALLVLLLLLTACLVGVWNTRSAMTTLPSRKDQASSASAGQGIVDQSPWQSAQTLAALAVTAEEKEYAQEAERLADHSVDQAFAAALRKANLQTQQRTLTGEALALSQKLAQLQQFVSQDQEAVNRLEAATKGAKPEENADTGDDSDLGIAKAQLQLDSDELGDLTQAMQQAEGDEASEIKSELETHEASMKLYDSQAHQPGDAAVVSAARNGTLAGRIAGWFRQNSREQLLQQARQQADAKANDITTARNAMQTEINSLASSPVFAGDSAGRLARIQARSTRRQLLSIYDDRIQTEQRLASVYQKWEGQVQRQHGILLHLIASSFAWILAILLGMVMADALMHRLVKFPVLDTRSRHTMRAVLELTMNVVGVGCILIVVFGPPRQIGTILGLGTAALTIVLQDFLLAFLGWFVLIGRRGIQVGDRVEIDGIGGEVTEIGLMATSLLETGPSGDRNNPTGRQIRLMNGFAIRGKYLNFSTAGQWMWDQFEVTIPEGLDRSEMLKKILEAVETETAKDALQAEQEWSRAARGARLSVFNATPSVNLQPSAEGRRVQVRYVTGASDLSEKRARLYRRVVDLLHEAAGAGVPQ
ncbi:MAG TPA: mechanosensitive ion channel domain-containing protein [Terracidiphilus sp.]|jgi:small-conductance mechanosensitive channel|nr:mechanosensitive ion channel domain-containing protein [Terracidiphilus sp.]